MDKTYDTNAQHMDSEHRRMRTSYVRFTRELAEMEAEPGPTLYANDWPHGEFRFEELPPPAGECVCGHPLHDEPCSVPVRMDEELRFVEEVCGCKKVGSALVDKAVARTGEIEGNLQLVFQRQRHEDCSACLPPTY